ncbi:Cullin binding-domain-containing protein [Haematococcus lacustris]
MNRAQKEKLAHFRAITGAGDKAAAECLKQLNWALEPAIDHFYTCGKYSSAPSIDNRAIETLYKSYKDRDEDAITAEGIMKFCADLKVEPADVVMLVIACYMNAAYMGEFTKDEFISGMVKLGCDSMDKLRNKLPELRAELKSPSRFKDIYNYAYTFSREKGQKCVQLDTALGMWQLLFPADRPWPLLDDWCEFLTKQHGGKAISKDTWTQLLDFIRTVKPDLSNFDPDNSAWPYLIDEFVEAVRAKRSA